MNYMYDYVESNASIIRLNRGDTYKKPLFINIGSRLKPVRYTLQDGDKLYFGLLEPNKLWEQSIIRQIYTTDTSEFTEDGDVYIKIKPEETEYLIPGTYYYEIKLLRKVDEVDEVTTVVPRTLFYIV